MMKLKVLLLEDDHSQRQDIRDMLEEEFHASVEVRSSEWEFLSKWDQMLKEPPDFAILDVMVCWAKPTREQTETPEEAKHPDTAGLRCAQKIRSTPETGNVKVILYSVLSQEEDFGMPVPEGVDVVVKEADFEDLIEAIRNSLGQPA